MVLDWIILLLSCHIGAWCLLFKLDKSYSTPIKDHSRWVGFVLLSCQITVTLHVFTAYTMESMTTAWVSVLEFSQFWIEVVIQFVWARNTFLNFFFNYFSVTGVSDSCVVSASSYGGWRRGWGHAGKIFLLKPNSCLWRAKRPLRGSMMIPQPYILSSFLFLKASSVLFSRETRRMN